MYIFTELTYTQTMPLKALMYPYFRRSLLSCLIIFLCNASSGQKQINHWYFAANNGIDFSSGTPVNVAGGQAVVMEGAASISDKTGRLLFYTDGITVWTKTHTIMQNGTGLHGGYGSSTQSSIIVPKGTNEIQYYIFTADEEAGPWGLKYSVVDMSLNGGNGAVITKNVPLITPTCEKVTAVRHCNKKDYWIITHEYNSNAFYAYLASEAGVDPTPVISRIGKFIQIDWGTMAGGLKASPDGSKVIAAQMHNGIELFDFDNQTGILSNVTEIFRNANAGHHGVEFSADSRMLYASVSGYWDAVARSRFSGVFQFDVSLSSRNAIVNSKNQLARYPVSVELGPMTRGPDNKIYMAQYRQPYLSVINSPETYGNGCGFVDIGFALPSTGLSALPNFVNRFPDTDTFYVRSSCINQPVKFDYTKSFGAGTLSWDFGDPASGAQNSSVISNPTHTYSAGGVYTVKLTITTPCGTDQLSDRVTVGDVAVDLGNDKGICQKGQVVLQSNAPDATKFLWQDGVTTSSYTAKAAGLYWVEVANAQNGCIKRDSIVLTEVPLPDVHLGKDTLLCTGQALLLDARNPGATYQWQNNSNQQIQSVNTQGRYWVQVTKDGCKAQDTIDVNFTKKPAFSLGADQFLCPDVPLVLSTGLRGVDHIWQDGTTASDYLVKREGLYYVDASNICGVTRDSIKVHKGICALYVPNSFSPNSDKNNDLFKVRGVEQATSFSLSIYNRWGQLVFTTTDKSKGWDGKINGAACPSGNYVYIIQYRTGANAPQQAKKGVILLVR